MFRRRQIRTHGQLVREELTESFGHLRMAASHAATGAAGRVAPGVVVAREAVNPRLRTVRGRAVGVTRKSRAKVMKTVTKKESAMAGRRWPVMLGGLVVAGAAAGAVGALVKRRRAKRSWDEYDSTRSTGDSKAIFDSAKSTVDSGIGRAASAAATAKDRTSDLIGSHLGTHSEPGSRESSMATGVGASSPSRSSEYKQQNDDMYSKPSPTTSAGAPGTTAKNSRP